MTRADLTELAAVIVDVCAKQLGVQLTSSERTYALNSLLNSYRLDRVADEAMRAIKGKL